MSNLSNAIKMYNAFGTKSFTNVDYHRICETKNSATNEPYMRKCGKTYAEVNCNPYTTYKLIINDVAVYLDRKNAEKVSEATGIKFEEIEVTKRKQKVNAYHCMDRKMIARNIEHRKIEITRQAEALKAELELLENF